MEYKGSSVLTIVQELHDEAAWTEMDLLRRRILRESFAQEEISLFISSLLTSIPRISIKPPRGGPRPHFVRVVSLVNSEQLTDPENHRDLIGIVGLEKVQDPTTRLQMIAQALPTFIESFGYTQRVPIKIFDSSKKPVATISFEEDESLPKVTVSKT